MAAPLVAWLERPQHKLGLDNLGTQQPCVFIYSGLLPGITNVTDRASYYGFYPWFIRAFERRFPGATEVEFKDALRRADCLLTLTAERHGLVAGDHDDALHAGACPGRLKLGPAAQTLSASGERLRLSDFAERSEENTKRYFKNPLGGLGQYYLGPLRDEYSVLAGDARRGVKYTMEHGAALGDAYGCGLPEDRFFDVLAQPVVGAADLDGLSEFCPCALRSDARAKARVAIATLLFDDRSANGRARRRTLDLILCFIEAAAGAPALDPVKAFLRACYAGHVGAVPWQAPDALEGARVGWGLYARNEMMSLAWIALFKICLDEMDGTPLVFSNVGSLCDHLISKPTFGAAPTQSFAACVQADERARPLLTNVDANDHEFALWQRLIARPGPQAIDTMNMLIRLISRFGDESECYVRAHVSPASLSPYPLTLNALNMLARGSWSRMSGRDWLHALLVEVLVTHQRIAIRKLGQSGEDTLMFRANDAGFFVHRKQERVVETQPRLTQAFQILRDLGLADFKEGHTPTLTARGYAQLQASGHE